MRLVSYFHDGRASWGVLEGDQAEGVITDLGELAPSLRTFLESGGFEDAESQIAATVSRGRHDRLAAGSVILRAPVPDPWTVRDAYAFRQHVEAGNRARGVEMPPVFDEIPVFYLTNPRSIVGPGPVEVREQHLEMLDFELEIAAVIGRECRDVSAVEADEYILGYTIMNDWSARALQRQEMQMALGPMKGKDFATSLGPWITTRDELAPRRIESPEGERYDLAMTATVNGVPTSAGNFADITWTFAQILERASYGCTLGPGDVIGSGTVGTGCYLELNLTGVTNRWLEPGDEVALEVEGLGRLANTVAAS